MREIDGRTLSVSVSLKNERIGVGIVSYTYAFFVVYDIKKVDFQKKFCNKFWI